MIRYYFLETSLFVVRVAKIHFSEIIGKKKQYANLERYTKFSDCQIHKLTHPIFFLALGSIADAPHHSSVALEAKNTLQELAFSRNGLVNPSQHISDITQGVMCMQFDRPRIA